RGRSQASVQPYGGHAIAAVSESHTANAGIRMAIVRNLPPVDGQFHDRQYRPGSFVVRTGGKSASDPSTRGSIRRPRFTDKLPEPRSIRAASDRDDGQHAATKYRRTGNVAAGFGV